FIVMPTNTRLNSACASKAEACGKTVCCAPLPARRPLKKSCASPRRRKSCHEIPVAGDGCQRRNPPGNPECGEQQRGPRHAARSGALPVDATGEKIAVTVYHPHNAPAAKAER